MCGILAILNEPIRQNINIDGAIEEGKKRGPENTKIVEKLNLKLIFHRLAINGLNDASMQPIELLDCVLICNGEIFNYKKLFNLFDIKPSTNSDCEIIIHLYRKLGIEKCLQLLDGEFAFILYDQSIHFCKDGDRLFFARDIFGTRPLYIGSNNNDLYALASESKVMNYIDISCQQVPPGTYSYFHKSLKVLANWKPVITDRKYFNIPYYNSSLGQYENNMNIVCKSIYDNLCKAVKTRIVDTSERPIACLLSGGLDSSLVAAITSKYYDKQLHTFSIGMKGSLDLLNAKKVAKYINSKHHEIILTSEQFFDAIPEVIYNIESFDTTTVRASVGNYLISKYIANNSDAKVILNGDGSDELTGGYIYFSDVPNDVEFDLECRKLLDNIHYFDVLRSDRSISSNGLETRTPFLDKTLVLYYMSLPAELRNPKSDFHKNFKLWDELAEDYYFKNKSIFNYIKSRPEKLLLRYSVEVMDPTLLPSEILWRPKEAFSDGVSGESGSWFEIIQNKLRNYTSDNRYSYLPPTTKEQLYYRDLYQEQYYLSEKCIPYFWMPNFTTATDSSARTLKNYTTR